MNATFPHPRRSTRAVLPRARRAGSVLAALTVLGAAAASVGAPAARADATTIVVRPGHSIQAALDRAPAHGTVHVAAGVYAENLFITKPVHVLSDGARLVPPAAPKPNPCFTVSPEDRMPGICVLGDVTDLRPGVTPKIVRYVDDVLVAGLRITGFPGHGVHAFATERLVLDGDELDHNAMNGAISLASHFTTYHADRVHDNGAFGLTVEDAPRGDSAFRENRVTRNNGIGILVRDSDGASIRDNDVAANCAGVFVLQSDRDEPTSDIAVEGNRVHRNNRVCPPNADGYPSYSGIGIALAGGVTHDVVTRNDVTGQRANGDTMLPGAGILLLDTSSFGGAAPAHDSVTANVLSDNTPLDILVTTSEPNNVTGNDCRASYPDVYC